MKKLTKLFVLILILSCTNETSVSLNNDSIVNEHFNKEEIQELNKLLKFFENEIDISTSTSEIYISYGSFFENLKPNEIEQLISFEKQESVLADLNPKLLNKLWYYEMEYVPNLNETVRLIRYPRSGQYFEFLLAASEKDKGIEKYFDDYTAAGDMSPTVLAYSMKYYKENDVNYDLSLERNRLIIAINYLITRCAFRKKSKKSCSLNNKYSYI